MRQHCGKTGMLQRMHCVRYIVAVVCTTSVHNNNKNKNNKNNSNNDNDNDNESDNDNDNDNDNDDNNAFQLCATSVAFC